jgi:uncharacterized membrane protein
VRRATDRLSVRSLGPREREAVEIIEARPGITIAELRATLGVSASRVWQILERVEQGRVHRQAAR